MSKNLITSPVGRTEWAKFFVADYKFNDAGEFGCKLHIDNTDAQQLVKKLDALQKQSLAAAAEETGKPASKIRQNIPYEIDDETGDVTIKVKLKENVNGRNGSFTQKPKVVDSQGQLITNEVPVWNGSRVRVSFTPVPYYTAMAGAGVSLRLYAVQIIEALSGGDGDAANLFDKVEDGFTVDTAAEGDEFADVPF